MINFPVEWKIFALFCLTELVFSASPGPAVLMVVSRAAAAGVFAAMATAFGVLCGNLIYFAISATAIGAFLFSFREWFFVVQWCGAAYLLYLAAVSGRKAGGKIISHKAAFGESLLVQLANPKTIIFFIAFLPIFIDPAKPPVAQIAVLAAASFMVELSVLCCYAYAAAKFAGIPGARSQRMMSKVGAVLLVAAAVSLILIEKE